MDAANGATLTSWPAAEPAILFQALGCRPKDCRVKPGNDGIAGGSEPYDPKPWFWSDQYDVKLQIGGLNIGYDSTLVRPGKRPGAQSVWYFEGDKLLAVDAMNDPPSYMVGRKLIEAGVTPEREKIADPAFPLNTLMPR